MVALAFLAVFVFIMFCVFVVAKIYRGFQSDESQEGSNVIPWLVAGFGIILFCFVPLIVYICKGGLSGMSFADAIVHIVDMVFSGEADITSNFIGLILGYAFIMYVIRIGQIFKGEKK